MFLSLDFERKKTIGGLFGDKEIKLIGTLPIVLFFKDGSKDYAKLKHAVVVKETDAELRNALGARAVDDRVGKKYGTEIMELVIGMERAINKATELGIYAGMPIKALGIVNYPDNVKKKEESIILDQHGNKRQTPKI